MSKSIAPPFLTSALDGGKLSVPRLGVFNPVKGARGTHWTGGRVDPRAGLGAVEYRKTS
jgi:hypothetical protein